MYTIHNLVRPTGSRGSSVSIVIGLPVGWPALRAHPVGTGGPFLGGKVAGEWFWPQTPIYCRG